VSDNKYYTYRHRREEYPLYNCKECGKFYHDREGTELDVLRGQQTDVIKIICKACAALIAAGTLVVAVMAI